MDDSSRGSISSNGEVDPEDPTWLKTVSLLVGLLAGAVAFLPFAFGTSPWDAVTLRVPGNQGNWWHFLAGAPFFLAYPVIWLRLRSLFIGQTSTPIGRRLIWGIVGLSITGTALVELPFLLHLAGTSEWQRLSVLSLGFGVVIASAVVLLLGAASFRRLGRALLVFTRLISLTRRCVSSSTAARRGVHGRDQAGWYRCSSSGRSSSSLSGSSFGLSGRRGPQVYLRND